MARLESPWWLIDGFAQNFSAGRGTYEGHLLLSESRWGGGFYLEVVGTPDYHFAQSNSFELFAPRHGWGAKI